MVRKLKVINVYLTLTICKSNVTIVKHYRLVFQYFEIPTKRAKEIHCFYICKLCPFSTIADVVIYYSDPHFPTCSSMELFDFIPSEKIEIP